MGSNLLRVGILGVLAIAGVTLFGTLGYAAPNETSAQAQYAPRNTAPPTISDTTPVRGQTLTANAGTWTGDQPIVFAYQWQRCNPGGQNCADIATARSQTYVVAEADVGNTLRVLVTGTNASGSSSATSATTERVAATEAPPPPARGSTVDVATVTPPARLIIDQVTFSPNPIRSRTASFTVTVRVVDTRGLVIRGALVFVRSTPLVTSTAGEGTTGQDGRAAFTVVPQRDFSIVFRRGYNLQFFVRARKPGENPLAGVSTRRLVQVGISPS